MTRSILLLALGITASTAFTANLKPNRLATNLFLEDHIADMIDRELWREHHKKDFEQEWMEKNRGAVLSSLNKEEAMVTDDLDQQEFRQAAKDRNLAAKNPAAYCADRCVATGHCDVYEDIFEFSPEEVMEFCNDCVLSEDEEPCEIPDAFYDFDNVKTHLRP